MRKRVRDRMAARSNECEPAKNTVHYSIAEESSYSTTEIFDIGQSDQEQDERSTKSGKTVTEGPQHSSGSDLWIDRMQNNYQRWIEQDGDWDRIRTKTEERNGSAASGSQV